MDGLKNLSTGNSSYKQGIKVSKALKKSNYIKTQKKKRTNNISIYVHMIL